MTALPSRLIGLADRMHALGGAMVIDSPSGRGTTLTADVSLTGA